MTRAKSVSAPVPNQKKFAPCNVHEAPESANLSVRPHHHQTVAELWNVDVKMDLHDMLITQERIIGPFVDHRACDAVLDDSSVRGSLIKVIQNVFQLMNVHKDNVVTTNIGTNADHTVWKISVVQQ